MTLSPLILKNLAAIEVGNHVAYAVAGGGWNLVACSDEDKILSHVKTLEEALAFLESMVEE